MITSQRYHETNYCLDVTVDYTTGKIKVVLNLHSPLISAFEFHTKHLKQYTLLIVFQIEKKITFVQKNKIYLQLLQHNCLCAIPHISFLVIYGVDGYISTCYGYQMYLENMYLSVLFELSIWIFIKIISQILQYISFTFLHDYLTFYLEWIPKYS